MSCFYHLKYVMTEDRAAAVVRSVATLLRRKGAGHLLRGAHDSEDL